MKRILCTGDSHTWGEGAAGLAEEFDPPMVAGDLRLTRFCSGGYVNRLRHKINQYTGSYAKEWTAKEISALPGASLSAPWAEIGEEAVSLLFSGALIRMEFCAQSSPSVVEVSIDGVSSDLIDLQSQVKNDYRLLTFHLEEGEHRLSLHACRGKVFLYRIESYGGSCAVINSGVGSSPSLWYKERFWESHVASVNPDIVLMEAHSINDWLTGISLDNCYRNLMELIEGFRSLRSSVILMTVSPILGEQRLLGLTTEYGDYVEISRRAAMDAKIPLCDANAIMAECIRGLPEGQASSLLFYNGWHVNDRGHALYAELLAQTLLNGDYLDQ